MTDIGCVWRLLSLYEHPLGVVVGVIGIAADGELGELAPPSPVGVVDEEPSVGRVFGMEGKAEQSLLDATGENPVSDVEKCRIEHLAIGVEDPDDSDSLDDEQAIVSNRSGEEGWLAETFEDQVEHHFLQRGESRGRNTRQSRLRARRRCGCRSRCGRRGRFAGERHRRFDRATGTATSEDEEAEDEGEPKGQDEKPKTSLVGAGGTLVSSGHLRRSVRGPGCCGRRIRRCRPGRSPKPTSP